MRNKEELPSDRAIRVATEKAEEKKQRDAKEGELRGAVARLASTGDGVIFLRWLKHECGFGESYLGLNPANGEIDEKRTTYAAMRLNLYWKVRKYLPLKQLIEVEHE
jgi:hypothetical protein